MNAKNDFYKLLVKLPNGKVIQTYKMDATFSTIEKLKLEVAFRSNTPYHKVELYWNEEHLYPENMLLKDIEIKGEKLPVNQFNISSLIFLNSD